MFTIRTVHKSYTSFCSVLEYYSLLYVVFFFFPRLNVVPVRHLLCVTIIDVILFKYANRLSVLPYQATDKLVKRGGVKLVLWAQTSRFSEMIRSCQCFPHVNKMPPSHTTDRTVLFEL